MINRDTDSPHRDFAYPPLIIEELETNTHCRLALACPQHIKQIQKAGPQKNPLDSTELKFALPVVMYVEVCSSVIRTTAINVRFKGQMTTNTMRYELLPNLAPA